MKEFFTKLLMLFFFTMTAVSGWAALSMSFSAGLYNILLGVMAAFFLFRALELVDKVNKLGSYYENPDKSKDNGQEEK